MKHKFNIVILIILLFIIKGSFYSIFVIPPTLGEAPDEVGHYSYIQYLYYNKSLPQINETYMYRNSWEIFGEYFYEEEYDNDGVIREDSAYSGSPNWIVQHPPFYYLIMTVFYSIIRIFTDHTIFIILYLRIINVLMGGLSLFFIYRTCKELKLYNMITISILIIISFFPMNSYIFSVINNDNLVILLSVISIYLWVKVKDGIYNNVKLIRKKEFYLFITVLALIVLTKYTGAVFVFAMGVVILMNIAKTKNFRRLFDFAIGAIAIFGIIVLPFLARNYLLYDHNLFPTASYGETHIMHNISIYNFLVDLQFPFIYIRNFVMCDGWKSPVYADRYTFSLFMSSFIIGLSGYIYSFKDNIKKLMSLNYVLIIFGLFVYFYRGEHLSFLLFISIFLVSAVHQLVQKGFSIEKDFIMIIVVSAIAFTGKLYQVAMMRGSLGAMHGRYTLFVLFPLVYFVIIGFKNYITKETLWYKINIISFLIFFSTEIYNISRLVYNWVL